MVYKKFIKRDGSIFGPYYYESYRDKDGKVKTRYINNSKKSRAINNANRINRFKFILPVLFILAGLLLILAAIQFQQQISDKLGLDKAVKFMGRLIGITGMDIFEISQCRDLDSENEYYKLASDISDAEINGACFNITANNIVLDCDGKKIESNRNGIIITRTAVIDTNVTIENCSITAKRDGMLITRANNNIILNMFLNSSNQGMVFLYSGNNLVKDVYNKRALGIYGSNNNIVNYTSDSDASVYGTGNIIVNSSFNSTYRGLIVYADNDSYCNNTFENILGLNSKPIAYFHEQVNISNWDNNFSQIVLCNADNSIIENITYSFSPRNNENAISIIRTDNSLFNNITINNANNGLYVYNSSNNIIKDSYFNASNMGVSLYGLNNSFIHSDFGEGTFGIFLSRANNIKIIDCYFHQYTGIISPGSMIYNLTILDSNFANGSIGVNLNSISNLYINNSNFIWNEEFGISVGTSSGTLENLKISNNYNNGIKFLRNTGFLLRNIMIDNNLIDFNFDADNYDEQCNNIMENVSINGKPLIYINETSSISNIDNVSQLILCNADDSRIENLSIGSLSLARVENSVIKNVSLSNSYYGAYLSVCSSNNLSDFYISNASIPLQVSNSYRNIFNNTDAFDSSPMYYIGAYLSGASFSNSFINSRFDYFRTKGSNVFFDDTYFIDTYIRKYNFAGDSGNKKGILIFENSSFGKIKFLEQVNGSGSNLSQDIVFGRGSAYIGNGFDKPAEISLYEMPESFLRPWIVKDDYRCLDCFNSTSLNNETVVFNVTGAGNYSIQDVNNPASVFLILNSSSGLNNAEDNVTAFASAYDADGDNVTFVFDWLKNSKSIAVLNVPFEAKNDVRHYVKDYSSFSNNGVVYGFPEWNRTLGICSSGGFDFDGIDDYISISSKSLALKSFSIFGWIKIKEGDNPTIISKTNVSGLSNYNLGLKNHGQEYILDFKADGLSPGEFESDIELAKNEWHYVGIVVNASSVKMYIDGEREKSIGYFGNFYSDASSVLIGSSNLSHFFNGSIDNLRVYNSSLSDEQARQIYSEEANCLNTSTISSTQLRIGEIWTIRAWANDGIGNGFAQEASLLIGCGNSICDSGESCSVCSSDCGICSGGSGGGGSGGGCIPRWSCGDWNQCEIMLGCKGDLSNDGRIDQRDIDILMSCYNMEVYFHPECAPADFDNSGRVGAIDINFISTRVGQKCPSKVARTCIDLDGCNSSKIEYQDQNCILGSAGSPSGIGNCVENWQCEWASCSGGFSNPVNCIDKNGCFTIFNKPKKVKCESPSGMPSLHLTGCNPRMECGNWSECSASYNFGDILSGRLEINGSLERTCKDLAGCSLTTIEKQECSIRVPIQIKNVDWCEKKYVEIYDSNKLVSKISGNSVLDMKKIDISFFATNFTGYCDYCFDNVKNYDEQGIDCGGSCSACAEMPLKENDFAKWLAILLWIAFGILLIIVIFILRKEDVREVALNVNKSVTMVRTKEEFAA